MRIRAPSRALDNWGEVLIGRVEIVLWRTRCRPLIWAGWQNKDKRIVGIWLGWMTIRVYVGKLKGN